MALGNQTNKPVTAFVFDVNALTGAVTGAGAVTPTLTGTLVDGTYDNTGAGYATTTDGAGTDCTVSITISGTGTAVAFTIVDAGTGYEAGDTLVAAESLDFSDQATGTLVSDVDSILGEIASVTVTDGGTGFEVGDVISVDELAGEGSGTGLAMTVASVTTPATGDVATLTVTAGGTGYAATDADMEYVGTTEGGVSDPRYSDHSQYELGGNQYEYTNTDDSVPKSTYTPEERAESLALGTHVGDPSNALDTGQRFTDNASSVKLVLKADEAQWQVQQIDVDSNGSSSIVVFAEPNVVDRNGYRVGHTIRAEDMVDEFRCVANGFFWNRGNNNTGDAGQGEYGYCMEKPIEFDPTAFLTSAGVAGANSQAGCDSIASGYTWDTVDTCELTAAADADCPVGYKFDGVDGCTAYTATEVNAMTQSATQIKRNECIASGNHWEPGKAGGLVVSYTTTASVPGAITITDGGSGYSVDDAITTSDSDVVITVTAVTANNRTNDEGGVVTAAEFTSGTSATANGAVTGVFDENGKCISTASGQHDNFSLANFNYSTTSTPQQYAKTVCEQYGFRWNDAARTCVADSDHSALVTKATCVAAGHVWIAGSCYDGADFGDGHNRIGSFQQDPTTDPK